MKALIEEIEGLNNLIENLPIEINNGIYGEIYKNRLQQLKNYLLIGEMK